MTKQKIIYSLLAIVLCATSTTHAGWLASWDDRVEQDGNHAVVNYDQPSKIELTLLGSVTALLAGATSWVAYKTFAQPKLHFAITRKGIRFPGETEVTSWKNLSEKITLEERVVVHGNVRHHIPYADFAGRRATCGKEILLGNSGIDFDDLVKLVSYYRNDKTRDGFAEVKKLQTKSVHVMKKETRIHYAKMSSAGLSLLGLATAGMAGLTGYRMYKKISDPDPFISIQPDGVVLHSKGGVKIPAGQASYLLEEKVVNVYYDQHGRHESRKTILTVSTDANNYTFTFSSTFDYDKFVELLNCVQFPVVSVARVNPRRIIFKNGAYIRLRDIKRIVIEPRVEIEQGPTFSFPFFSSSSKKYIHLVKKDGSRLCLNPEKTEQNVVNLLADLNLKRNDLSRRYPDRY